MDGTGVKATGVADWLEFGRNQLTRAGRRFQNYGELLVGWNMESIEGLVWW